MLNHACLRWGVLVGEKDHSQKARYSRVWGEVDIAFFPLLCAVDCLFELDRICDVAEAKGHGPHLEQESISQGSPFSQCIDRD